jgi:ribosomal protein S21
MSKIVIEVKKNTNENNATLLRRFSRKVMDSGIIMSVKKKRYNERETSKLSLKEMKLRRLTRHKEVEKLKKLGKMKEREGRSR